MVSLLFGQNASQASNADKTADLAILREGCFRYFELGGEAVAGPVSLLSAYVSLLIRDLD